MHSAPSWTAICPYQARSAAGRYPDVDNQDEVEESEDHENPQGSRASWSPPRGPPVDNARRGSHLDSSQRHRPGSLRGALHRAVRVESIKRVHMGSGCCGDRELGLSRCAWFLHRTMARSPRGLQLRIDASASSPPRMSIKEGPGLVSPHQANGTPCEREKMSSIKRCASTSAVDQLPHTAGSSPRDRTKTARSESSSGSRKARGPVLHRLTPVPRFVRSFRPAEPGGAGS